MSKQNNFWDDMLKGFDCMPKEDVNFIEVGKTDDGRKTYLTNRGIIFNESLYHQFVRESVSKKRQDE